MTVLMAHRNQARIENGRFRVDRKFLVGMQSYAQRITTPLVTVHPELAQGTGLMDGVEIACSELPFRVITVKVDGWGRALPDDAPRLREEISRSNLVYGEGVGATAMARALRVPYIPILEYDLSTQIVVATSGTRNPLRRANAALQTSWRYFAAEIPAMRDAHSLHCNGYPTYEAAKPHNPNRLLYLDSRMSWEMLIPAEQLAARLAAGREERYGSSIPAGTNV